VKKWNPFHPARNNINILATTSAIVAYITPVGVWSNIHVNNTILIREEVMMTVIIDVINTTRNLDSTPMMFRIMVDRKGYSKYIGVISKMSTP
jgi:hypothetical protein